MALSLLETFDHLIVFDTETTGLDFRRDEIIELGAVRLAKAGEEADYNALIPLADGKTVPPFISNLTGITDDLLRERGSSKEEACAEFCRLLDCENALLIAYNAQFDLNFLYWFLRKYGQEGVLKKLKFLDALTIYRDRRDYPHKLKDAIAAYALGDAAVNSHRAVDDARATVELLGAMEREKDDLMRYVNLFGYHPKYGVSGNKISTITYCAQPFDRRAALYDQ